MAGICQMENSSLAPERGAGGEGGGNSHSKVRTAFFPGRYFFFQDYKKKVLYFSVPLSLDFTKRSCSVVKLEN